MKEFIRKIDAKVTDHTTEGKLYQHFKVDCECNLEDNQKPEVVTNNFPERQYEFPLKNSSHRKVA